MKATVTVQGSQTSYSVVLPGWEKFGLVEVVRVEPEGKDFRVTEFGEDGTFSSLYDSESLALSRVSAVLERGYGASLPVEVSSPTDG